MYLRSTPKFYLLKPAFIMLKWLVFLSIPQSGRLALFASNFGTSDGNAKFWCVPILHSSKSFSFQKSPYGIMKVFFLSRGHLMTYWKILKSPKTQSIQSNMWRLLVFLYVHKLQLLTYSAQKHGAAVTSYELGITRQLSSRVFKPKMHI